MGLLEKIETLINAFLIKLGELIWKNMPAFIKKAVEKYGIWKEKLIAYVKALPQLLLNLLKKLALAVKANLAAIDFKGIFQETFLKVSEKYKAKTGNGFLRVILIPFGIIGEWLSGLSAGQSLLLLGFTCSSLLAIIGIGFSGHKLMKAREADRSPASVEITYDRPDYYKKETRHFDISNLRLPVYVAEVNEIRSVDIDFTATVSNRSARKFLEKQELQLRDHLILHVEPSIASFPLEEEGKDIIRKKIWMEINEFLKTHEIEGEVQELKITYVLAN